MKIPSINPHPPHQKASLSHPEQGSLSTHATSLPFPTKEKGGKARPSQSSKTASNREPQTLKISNLFGVGALIFGALLINYSLTFCLSLGIGSLASYAASHPTFSESAQKSAFETLSNFQLAFEALVVLSSALAAFGGGALLGAFLKRPLLGAFLLATLSSALAVLLPILLGSPTDSLYFNTLPSLAAEWPATFLGAAILAHLTKKA